MKDYHTLRDICIEADVSAPWVKKVQNMLGLGKAGNGKGSKSYYNDEQLHIYKMVKMLRLGGIEFNEIKHIYKRDKTLTNFGNSSDRRWIYYRVSKVRSKLNKLIELVRRD